MHMQVKNLELKNSPLQKVLVIIGPTASGKTALAIRLARKFGGEIVSADSRQVYRGMDIGTGKTPRDTNAKIKYEKITDARSRTAGYSSRRRNIRPEIGLPSGLSPPLRSGLAFIPTAERRGILPEIIKTFPYRSGGVLFLRAEFFYQRSVALCRSVPPTKLKNPGELIDGRSRSFNFNKAFSAHAIKFNEGSSDLPVFAALFIALDLRVSKRPQQVVRGRKSGHEYLVFFLLFVASFSRCYLIFKCQGYAVPLPFAQTQRRASVR